MAFSTIDKSTLYQNTVLWAGTGSSNAITGVGFQPDFLWAKDRDQGSPYNNILVDVIRGSTERLYSNGADAQSTGSTGVLSFDSDGFTLGTGANLNNSGDDNVGWSWKAGTTTGIAG